MKSIYVYNDPSPYGFESFYDQIVKDASDFTHSELIGIIKDKSLNLDIRETALFMIGCQWTNDALDEIYALVTEYTELNRYVYSLLSVFGNEYAVKIAKKLYDKKLMNKLSYDICKSGNKYIKNNRGPQERWGKAVFKSE